MLEVHHTEEDTVFFPWLTNFVSESDKLQLEEFTSDHRQLQPAIHKFEQVLDQLKVRNGSIEENFTFYFRWKKFSSTCQVNLNNPKDFDFSGKLKELAAATKDIQDILFPHLEKEEKMITQKDFWKPVTSEMVKELGM